MAYFRCGGGSGGNATILSGHDAPTSALGKEGDLYFQTGFHGALLHFDESVTTDEVSNNIWQAVTSGSGSPVLSSDQSKFGGKSLYLPSGSYIQIAPSDAVVDNLKFGTNDFTICAWLYPSTSGRQAFFAMSSDCYLGMDLFFNGSSANMWMGSGGWSVIQSDRSASNSGIGTISLTPNAWNHVAYIRNGTKCRSYVNGQLSKETVIGETDGVGWQTSSTTGHGFGLGKWGGIMSYPYNGYIDEFMIINGHALWEDEFTPPNAPFSISDMDDIVYRTYVKHSGQWRSIEGSDLDNII